MIGSIRRYLKGRFLHKRLSGMTMQERFADHYRTGWWFDNGESLSGSGSTLEATTRIRAELLPFLAKWKVTCLLDAPCGDWNWMKTLTLPPGLTYIGADIVPELVEKLQTEFRADRVTFQHIDITRDKLPAADMMMCRDALFHLSHEDIGRFFDNFLASGIPLLLTTHMPQVPENRDIVTGAHRPLNLERAPFNLPAPMDRFADFTPPRREKYMALWSRDQIAAAFATAR